MESASRSRASCDRIFRGQTVTAAHKTSLEGGYAYCEALLRAHDKDRFLADLFVPASVRAHVHALHAFSFEIARIRDVVSGPMPGELRHQWWRDALEDGARGEAGANPVAGALIDTIERFGLSRASLVALIDARGFDLYDDPMPDIQALEGYCRDTSSVLFRLVAEILGSRETQAISPVENMTTDGSRSPAGGSPHLLDEAAHRAGLAYAFTGLIRAFARHAARGQIYLPVDILRRHGSTPEEVREARATPALLAAIGEWRGEARRHLAAACSGAAGLAEAVKPAFVPLALVDPYLGLSERRSFDVFHSQIELPQWRRQWALWRGSPSASRSHG
jgi:phytoene synthase